MTVSAPQGRTGLRRLQQQMQGRRSCRHRSPRRRWSDHREARQWRRTSTELSSSVAGGTRSPPGCAGAAPFYEEASAEAQINPDASIATPAAEAKMSRPEAPSSRARVPCGSWPMVTTAFDQQTSPRPRLENGAASPEGRWCVTVRALSTGLTVNIGSGRSTPGGMALLVRSHSSG